MLALSALKVMVAVMPSGSLWRSWLQTALAAGGDGFEGVGHGGLRAVLGRK